MVLRFEVTLPALGNTIFKTRMVELQKTREGKHFKGMVALLECKFQINRNFFCNMFDCLNNLNSISNVGIKHDVSDRDAFGSTSSDVALSFLWHSVL